MCRHNVRGIILTGIIGDILGVEADAVVNPANSYMIMGGGLAGVIKKRGGSIIEEEARKYAPVPIGKAIVTTAGSLPFKYVIHSPTMEEPAGRTDPDKVYQATKAAIQVAAEKGVSVLAIPGMGTGVGGLEPCSAVRAMFRAIKEYLENPDSIREIIVADLKEDIPKCFCDLVEEYAEMIGE